MIRRYLKVSISTTLPLYTYLTWLLLYQYPLNITLNDCSDMFCSKQKKKKERKVSAYRSFYIIIWMKQTPIHVSSSQKNLLWTKRQFPVKGKITAIYLIVVAHFPDVTAFRLFLVSWWFVHYVYIQVLSNYTTILFFYNNKDNYYK